MLKDYEFDDDDYKSDELQNCLYFDDYKFNKLFVFCQIIQGRRGYEFYRLLSIKIGFR
jgi:hypothetical protein